jgi:hypothetical protein
MRVLMHPSYPNFQSQNDPIWTLTAPPLESVMPRIIDRLPWSRRGVELDFQDLVNGTLAASFAISYLYLLGGEGICLHCNEVPFPTIGVVKKGELPQKGWT